MWQVHVVQRPNVAFGVDALLWAPTTHIGLFCAGLLVREHHARQVQGLQMPFATGPEHAHALQHVTAKAQPCQDDTDDNDDNDDDDNDDDNETKTSKT